MKNGKASLNVLTFNHAQKMKAASYGSSCEAAFHCMKKLFCADIFGIKRPVIKELQPFLFSCILY